MRRFPKTPTSDSNRSTSPTLTSSNATTNSSTISASANSNINPTNNTNSNGTTFSWSSVAAANNNNTTSNRSLHSEASEKSDVPGAGDSALNPFKYSKEFMLKLYKPVGLPLEFERHEYVTSEEPLQPMAMIIYTEQEQKLLSGTSVNSELTRRIVSNASSGTVTGSERVERDRVPFPPRGEKHINTGLTSPRSERFGGIIGGVLSGRTSPRSSRPPRTSGSLNLSSADDPVWNGVTRHAVGTFDSNGVFRIPGNNVEDETLDKVKKEDTERGKKFEQELERKNPTDRSDANTYSKSSQSEIVTTKSEREMNNESMNGIEDSTRNEFMEDLQENTSVQLGLQQETRHERQIKKNKVLQDWQESQSQSNQEIEESSLQRDQTDFHQEKQREQTSFQHSQRSEGEHQLLQQPQNNRKDDEKDLEHQDDDVLKEAFAYSNVGSNTPPLSPTGKTNKYTSAHSIIGTSNAFVDSNSGTASLFSGAGINVESRKVTSEQYKWMYRDPSGNIQGPFSSQEMNEWYKGGFFVHSLLVKRVEDTTFEPLGVLIRKTGDDERPFSAQIPGSRPSLTISMPNNSSRLVNDPFQRSWVGPNSPSTAQLFLDQQRFNPFGGTASVPNTPFDRYQFGSVFGRNDGGWGDLNSTNNTWGQTDSFTSNNESLSPRIQAPNSPPLFNNNSATFNVSPPQTYLDHQRVLSSQIDRQQQYLVLQQRQLQQNQQNQNSYPDAFIRQQHQSYVGMSGPVSAPISNAPTSPFTRATGWPATTTTEPTPSSPWGPGIGVTPSRATQSDEIGYFGLRKEGLQQSSRRNERQYEMMSGNIQDSSLDSKVNEMVKSMAIADDETHSKKIDEKVINEGKDESSASKNIVDETSRFVQKEELYRTKPSLREIQAEEERRKKQQQEKEKFATSVQQTSNQPIAKAPQPQKINSAAWGNNNSITPSSPAPWAKDEDHTAHKTPSLREIQEMEARKAAERKAVSTVTAQATVMVTKEESTPSNSSWGIIGQNSSSTSNSSSLSTSPVVTTPATSVTNSMGKRYADTVATGSGGPGTKKIGSTSMNAAWTTVASKSNNRSTTAISPQSNIGTTVNVLSTKPTGKDSTVVWDMDSHKGINGLRSTPVSLSLSKTSANSGAINANSSNEHSTPRPPSEEFLKWCRQALRGLNDVNVEDFIQMLLTFPLDPPPATIEIIQESVYANSPTLDGRRFADEFIKRRKADASGLPLNSFLNTNTEGKSGKDTGTGNSNTKDDHSINSAGAFKVVTTKKGKKKH
ncbi:10207_t:CDS:2 [Rhizophagus irregularis]|nr:10207_t:CDS:2 [Rhizophagus irregularis]